MKLNDIEVSRALETPAVPALNETQKMLARALESFGSEGERWHRVTCDGVKRGGMCTMLAVYFLNQETCLNPQRALQRALGHDATYNDVAKWNDAPERTFADVKALYLKAIELAA